MHRIAALPRFATFLATATAAGAGALTIPAAALAQEAAAPVADAPAETIAATSDEGRLTDSNIDRAFLLPTAETQPKGSIVFSDYELLFLGLTYGVTDDMHVTGTVMVPMGDDDDSLFFGIASAKYRFLKTGRLRLAAQGSVALVRTDITDDDMSETSSHTFFTLGGIASVCLDDGCNSLISASATTGFSADSDGEVRPIVYGGSIVQKLSRHVKGMAEFTSAGVFDNGDWNGADGGLLTYGARFYSNSISGDVGFIKPIGGDSGAFPLGFPFVAFTYRAL